jgi:myo-inositol-1-phosphate synthase
MHEVIGGYKIEDIEIVAAFDIDKRKVGKELLDAMWEGPNCAKKFWDGSFSGSETIVSMGHVKDGIAPHMNDYPENQAFRVASIEESDVASMLKNYNVDVLVCYMPVGADEATRFYAQACLDANCAMVNCAPSFIASDPTWAEKFLKAKIPIVGDDIKSQVGATIIHRTLTRLFEERGVSLKRTYQLNTGGNTDFLNMLAKDRLKSKKISKTNAVVSQLDTPINSENVHIGPSDYVPWQKDNKLCFLRMEGEGFGGQPIEIEMRLSVQDSPNSAGIVVDAIRCAALAKQRGEGGPILSASAWLMKSPSKQMYDTDAKEALEKFISNS